MLARIECFMSLIVFLPLSMQKRKTILLPFFTILSIFSSFCTRKKSNIGNNTGHEFGHAFPGDQGTCVLRGPSLKSISFLALLNVNEKVKRH